jgi:hypothetical protein
MIEAALKYLIGLCRPTTLRIGERDYSTTAIHAIAQPRVVPLDFATLDGFCEFIIGENEGYDWGDAGCKVLVESPERVSFVSMVQEPWLDRDRFARAVPPSEYKHPWGQYLDQEHFLIWLQSNFVPSDDSAALLRLVGNLRSERVATLVDDGTTQVASVKAGITKVNEIEVKNPVTLRPFRTFAEVEQPQSKFIVRLRDAKEGMPPGVALFEVADYSWKLKAMLSIKQYLAAKLEGSELPIFA